MIGPPLPRSVNGETDIFNAELTPHTDMEQDELGDIPGGSLRAQLRLCLTSWSRTHHYAKPAPIHQLQC
jgi:hypothetical protein